MSKLRLLIKRPGRENTRIPVIVDRREIIGNCISSLVDHLGFPHRDSLGRPLAYTLRPLLLAWLYQSGESMRTVARPILFCVKDVLPAL